MSTGPERTAPARRRPARRWALSVAAAAALALVLAPLVAVPAQAIQVVTSGGGAGMQVPLLYGTNEGGNAVLTGINKVFEASNYSNNLIYRFDGATETRDSMTIATTTNVNRLYADQTHNLIYATAPDGGNVTAYNGSTGSLTRTLSMPYPGDLYTNVAIDEANNRVWAGASLTSSYSGANTRSLTAWDSSGAVAFREDVTNSSYGAPIVAVDQSNGNAFYAYPGSTALYKLDGSSLAKTTVGTLASSSFTSFAVDPGSHKLLVSYGDGTVGVFSSTSGASIATWAQGGGGNAFVDPTLHVMYTTAGGVSGYSTVDGTQYLASAGQSAAQLSVDPTRQQVWYADTRTRNGGSPNMYVRLLQNEPQITSGALPTTVARGSAYSYQTTNIGTPSFTYSTTGTLPTGMSINSSTGLLSGTPTVGGRYNFSVVVTNRAGSDSKSVTLDVTYPPAITTQPTNQSQPAGTTLTFSAAANGWVTPTVQWEVSTDNGSTWSPISGATSTTYSTSMTAGLNGNKYHAIFTNSVGTVTSNAVTASLVTVPVISSASSAQVATGVPFSNTFTATGGGTITWSWISGSAPGLSINSSTGVLSGTPTTAGTNALGIRATNSAGPSSTFTFTLTTVDTPVLPTTTALSAAANQTAYTDTVAATSGTAPISYAVTSGALPAGLTLNTSTGAITGTPTASGPASFSVTATNVIGSATHAYTIAVADVPVLGALSQTTFALYGSVSVAVPATGATPVTFAVTSGSLPSGLTLNTNTGVISGFAYFGTANGGGPITFQVTAHNGNGYSTPRSYTLDTLAPPSYYFFPSQATVYLNDPTAQVQYTDANSSSNFTWTFANGSLPPGMTLDPNTGLVSGTPTTLGAYTFDLTATNSVGTLTNTVEIDVATPLTYPASLPAGVVGQSYTFDWGSGISGGNLARPLNYHDDPYSNGGANALPPGLSISGFGSSGGIISGTPTQAGTYTVSLSLEDQNQMYPAQLYTLVIGTGLPTVNGTTLPNGGVGTAYSQSLPITGLSPMTFAVSSGSLPAGLTLNTSTGVISGSPTVGGTGSFTVTASNSLGSVSQAYSIVVGIAPAFSGSTTLPTSPTGSAVSGISVATTAGTGPITYAVASGSLPAGLTLNTSTGAITGTPTSAGTSSFTISATNTYGSASQAYTMVTQAPPAFTSTAPTTGLTGSAFSYTPVVSGTGPFSYTVTSGALPAGLTLSPTTGIISGTPTGTGSTSFTLRVTGAAGSASQPITLVVSAAPSFVGAPTPATGVVGQSYSSSVAATIGTGPVTYAIASGSLPAGLSLNTSTGAISGTPTTTGSSTFTVSATNTQGSATQSFTIPVLQLPSVTGSASSGLLNTAYTFTPTVSGSAPITFAVTSGSLPTGLTLNTSTGVVSGTPTAGGSSSFTITGTNAAGSSALPITLVVNAAPSLVGVTAPADGLVGVAYTASVAGTGTAPVTYAVSTGALPAGLSLNASTGAITGTPTTTGSYSVGITATNTYGSTSATYPIVIRQLASFGSLPTGGLVGTAYSYTPTVTGTGPITYAITTGSLPAGLTLNASTGAITGTPTTSGSFSFSVTATSPAGPAVQPMTIAINQAPTYAGFAAPANAVQNAPYTGSAAVTGGIGITYAVTAGSLPTGLTLNTSTGAISGTPTGTGSSTFTVTATNTYGTATQAITIVSNALPSVSSTPPGGTVGTAYTYTPTTAGTGPFTYAVTTGSLPAGLTMNPTTGAITGTPSASGSAPVTITITGPGGSVTQTTTIAIAQAPSYAGVAPTPSAVSGVAYVGSAAVTAGTNVSYAVTAGSLPSGLSLNASTGAITGTTTAAGTSTFTVTATNSVGTASNAFSITINIAPVIISNSPGTAVVGSGYSYTPTVNGTGPFTFAVTGTLPPGVTLNASTGTVSGTPTASGAFTYTLVATGPGGSVSQVIPLQVNQPPSYVGVSPLTANVVGQSYSSTVAAPIGTGVTYAVTTGSLPAGVTLNAQTGAITGTTAAAGSTAFTVTATNAYGTATHQFTLVAQSLPTITPINPVTGLVGAPYTLPITAAGSGPIVYTVSSGTLPVGLTLNSTTGVISGTPTNAGTSTFAVTATGPAGSAVTPVSIAVAQAPTFVSVTQPPAAVVGSPYSASIAGAGTAPITYSITSGTLPTGVTLNAATGIVSGTPTVAGVSTFQVTATNALGAAVQQYTVTVGQAAAAAPTPAAVTTPAASTAPAPSTTAIPAAGATPAPSTTTTPGAGATPAPSTTATPGAGATPALSVAVPAVTTTVGSPISIQPKVAPGAGASTYVLSSGSLPAGVTLNPTTGVLSGSPTAIGVSQFSIVVTNARGTWTQRYNLMVRAAPGSVPAPKLAIALHVAVGAEAQGAAVTAKASGLLPGSSWTLTMHSKPIVLAHGTVPASGSISKAAHLPSSIAAGSHTVILNGTSMTGTPAAARTWFAVTSAKRVTGISTVGPVKVPVTHGQPSGTGTHPGSGSADGSGSPDGGLATTGFAAMPLIGGAAMVVLVGLGLLLFARRRRTRSDVERPKSQ